MNSKAIQNQVKNKVLPGRRALTGGPHHSSPSSVCVRCVSLYTCVYLCSHAHACICGCLCVRACVCVSGRRGGNAGVGWRGSRACSLPELHFPRSGLPVSPLPPWHFLCPHIKISGASAVEHEPFLIFHSHHRAEGNICIHKSLFRMGL